MSGSHTNVSLVVLPTELQLQIISHLRPPPIPPRPAPKPRKYPAGTPNYGGFICSLRQTPSTLPLEQASRTAALLDLQHLRLSHPKLYTLIPPPTYLELLELATLHRINWFHITWGQTFYACISCLRLRPSREFGSMVSCLYSTVELKRQALERGERYVKPAKKRFCLECVIRELRGEHRYEYGDRWEGKLREVFVRCEACKEIAGDGERKDIGPCRKCNWQEYWDEIPLDLWRMWTGE